MKTYIIQLKSSMRPMKIRATHFAESPNMVYFYSKKDAPTIDDIVASFSYANLEWIKELV